MSKKNSNVLSLKNILIKDTKTANNYYNFKKKLEKNISKKQSFVVAVSGGADSLSLAAFSHLYSKEKKIKIFYALVDHNLRKGSKSEANLVKKLFKKQKILLNILTNKEKIKKNIQSKARDVRYKLLAKFCRKKELKYILTGHHSNDQVETFLIRLSRGSGVQGLSSMHEKTKITRNIKLIRPFLEIKKEDLKNVAKKVFGKIIKDPSNTNKKYLRTKIRALTKEMEKSGIHHDQIIKSIKNLASSRDTLNNYVTTSIKKCVKKKKKETLVDLKKLFLESDEIKFKVLSHAIKNISKSYYPPRSKKILNVINGLKKDSKSRTSLGGCFLEKTGNYLLIKKEV